MNDCEYMKIIYMGTAVEETNESDPRSYEY